MDLMQFYAESNSERIGKIDNNFAKLYERMILLVFFWLNRLSVHLG